MVSAIQYKRDREHEARPYHENMAIISCDGRGIHGHGGRWRATDSEPPIAGGCPRCVNAVPQSAFHIRIDDAENIGKDRADPRIRGINLGLPGASEVIGHRSDGSPITRYRPASSDELNSNRKLREHARRHGLTPLESGRYRSR